MSEQMFEEFHRKISDIRATTLHSVCVFREVSEDP